VDGRIGLTLIVNEGVNLCFTDLVVFLNRFSAVSQNCRVS
jgi:hypothetical protein